jgi:glycosyltransferase involved in cell wall biosynthesis
MRQTEEIIPNQSKKIKVAHIITRLDVGGSSENVLLNSIYIDKKIFEVSIIFGLSKNPLNKLIEKAKGRGVKFIEIRTLRRSPNFFFDVMALIRLIDIIKKEKFDIIHTHTSKAGCLGRLAAWIDKTPHIIHSPHGHIFYGYYPKIFNFFIILTEKILGKITNKFITLTSIGIEEHLKFGVGKRNKFKVIYSGVEEKVQPLLENNHTNSIKEKLTIVTISRLVKVKNVDTFIMAAREVIDKTQKKIEFLIVGDGPLKPKLKKLANDLNLNKSLFFLGQREDIGDVLKRADIFCLTSLNEGMGRVLIQAQKFGLPVVATKVGGVSEVVKENETGFLVEPKDYFSLSQNLLRIIEDDDLRNRMRKQVLNWVKGRFTSKEMVYKTERLYLDLIRKR